MSTFTPDSQTYPAPTQNPAIHEFWIRWNMERICKDKIALHHFADIHFADIKCSNVEAQITKQSLQDFDPNSLLSMPSFDIVILDSTLCHCTYKRYGSETDNLHLFVITRILCPQWSGLDLRFIELVPATVQTVSNGL